MFDGGRSGDGRRMKKREERRAEMSGDWGKERREAASDDIVYILIAILIISYAGRANAFPPNRLRCRVNEASSRLFGTPADVRFGCPPHFQHIQVCSSPSFALRLLSLFGFFRSSASFALRLLSCVMFVHLLSLALLECSFVVYALVSLLCSPHPPRILLIYS